MDTTGVDSLKHLVHNCKQKRTRLIVCGLQHQPLEMVSRSGLLGQIGAGNISPDLASGLALATNPPSGTPSGPQV